MWDSFVPFVRRGRVYNNGFITSWHEREYLSIHTYMKVSSMKTSPLDFEILEYI